MEGKRSPPSTLPKPRLQGRPMIPLPIEAFEAGRERPPDFILQLERKKSFKLAHEQGAGNPCNKCGDLCPGFDLHFWRKICRHCKCGKQEHSVADEDNFHTVERLLGPRDKSIPKWTRMKTMDQTGNSQDVQYAWVPPGVSLDVAKEYMEKIPVEKQPIRGSEGDKNRKDQLQRQVPPHDMDDTLCHALTPEERLCLQQYVDNLKENAVGQGSVRICKLSTAPASTARSVGLGHVKHPPPAPFFLRRNSNNATNNNEPPSPQDWPPPPPPSAFHTDEVLSSPELKPSNMEPPSFPPPPPPSLLLKADGVDELGQAIEGMGLNNNGWKEELTPTVRDQVVLKIVQTMYPEATFESMQEMPMHEFATFVGEKESQMYDKAGSLDDYCDHVEAIMRDVREEMDRQDPSRIYGNEVDQVVYAGDLDSSCRKCNKPLTEGEVLVVAERAGGGTWWHPECFCCKVCGEMLVDLIYFHHEGELYCGRHYAEAVSIPRCHACDELIFSKEYTLTAGATYHVKHFCCFGCDNPLADQKYVVMAEQQDQPHCLPCYQKYFGKVCRTCRRDIGPEEPALTHGTLHFHANDQCFSCDTCKATLLGGRFLEKDGFIFCSRECKAKKLVVETAI